MIEGIIYLIKTVELKLKIKKTVQKEIFNRKNRMNKL